MKKTFHRLHDIKICKLLNGYELSLTLHELTCNKPGPTLGLTATIHGNEDLPIEILRRFVLELEDLDFKGRVLLIPVANPLALGSFTRNNPIDMSNLNRVFPGSKDGTISDRIAYAMVTEYIPQVDYFVDFHSGAARICTGSAVEYTYVYPNTEELGKMLGLKYLYRGSGPLGSMADYLVKQNKPAVVHEIGGGLNNNHYINQGLIGIKNVMKYLKMIHGEPELPQKQYLIKDFLSIKSKNGGLYSPRFSIDSMHSSINKSELLGTIYSPYTFEEIESFYGPYDRNIIIFLRPDVCRVEAGDGMFQLGNADTIEQI